MILGQAQTTTFKLNLLQGLVNFNTGSPYTYKIALYNAVSTLNSETTAYTTQDEITGTGYVAGGKILTPTIGSDTSNNTAYVTFANVTWSPASFTTAGALIYNSNYKRIGRSTKLWWRKSSHYNIYNRISCSNFNHCCNTN
jgi:hypothetical protein